MEMEWLIILLFKFLVSFCFAYALAYTFHLMRYHPFLKPGAPRMPPGSLGLPLLGETLEFLGCFYSGRPDVYWKRRTSSGKYRGLFRTHLLGQPTICVTEPKLAAFVLTNDSLFGLGWPKHVQKLVGEKSLLSASRHHDHRLLRRLSAGSITSTNALKRELSEVQELTLKALSSWEEKGEVAVFPEMLKITFSITAKILLSYEPGEEADEFLKEVNEVAAGLPTIPIDLPGTPYNQALKARRKVAGRLKRIIERRKGRRRLESNKDILDYLMGIKDENGRGPEDDEIIDTLLGFLIGGQDTTAYAVHWILYYLQKHPQVLHKLQAEQQHIQELKGSDEHLSISDIKEMTYMAKVIQETLRIANIAPFTYRKALKDVELNDATIPKGWTVQVLFRAIHLDPVIYPNPHEFNPDRWLDEKPKIGAYIPFGGGSRGCVGADLAKLEISTILHHLVMKYRWEPISPNTRTIYLPNPKLVDGYRVKFSKSK